MPQYALVIAYDGTRFAGWQEQPANRTVAGVIKATYAQTFGHTCALVGASRTDAGVHALGQVASLRTDLVVDPKRLQFALQNALPSDIFLRAVGLARPGYHPHHNVLWKEYHYYVSQRRLLPGFAPFSAIYPYPIDRDRLAWFVARYVGTYDFWSFGSSSSDEAGVETTCTLMHAEVVYMHQHGVYKIIFRGDRFIHHMVRRMVGAALRYSSCPDLSESYSIACMSERIDRMLIPTASAQGSVLRKIMYTNGVAHESVWS
jgi:tRNA pseudouridine38-40 synthase